MIVVTRLNDRQFAINPDLIERIHVNPDTTLVMVDGAKYIVTESMSEVIDRIAYYRARVIALAHSGAALEQAGPQLGIVSDLDDSADAAADDSADSRVEQAVPLRPRKI